MIQGLRSILLLVSLNLIAADAFALNDAAALAARFQSILKEKIPNAEIRIPNLGKLVKAPEVAAIDALSSVRLTEDRPSGVAVFELFSTDGTSTKVQTPYQALARVPVAARRIYPNTRLKKEDFRIDTINLATGHARDYRGAIIADESRLERMETRQTILEGQFVVSNAVQKLPDVRKGEMVKLELVSGDLSLTTSAIVQENASVGDSVHVLTAKSKREIVGKVRADRSIEVNL